MSGPGFPGLVALMIVAGAHPHELDELTKRLGPLERPDTARATYDQVSSELEAMRYPR